MLDIRGGEGGVMAAYLKREHVLLEEEVSTSDDGALDTVLRATWRAR